MRNSSNEKKRRTIDPGNALFIFYIGMMVLFVVLAMFADGRAEGAQLEQNEVTLSEVKQ